MQRIDFYLHNGCLSEPSVLSLARDLLELYPTWTVTVHQLGGNEAATKGFPVLPAIVINDQTVATGVPNKDWLRQKVEEWIQLKQ